MTANGASNQPYLALGSRQGRCRALCSRAVPLSCVAVALVLLPLTLRAQQIGVDVASAPQEAGSDLGNYHTNFNMEAGYRFTGINGNIWVYDTMVDLQSGPRILSEELSMRSINHQGALFDRLSLSGFGYGGDPQTATRLRMS